MSTTSASTPVVTPVNADALAGVPNRGCTFANHAGRSPSLAIAMYTLGWPMRDDNSAVVMAARAPRDMTDSAQPIPAVLKATAKGASTSIFSYGVMPVMTRHMSAYSAAHTPRDPMIPTGRSRPGSAHSSAHVATVSNPTNEKNTTDAPASIPPAPFGANGVQLSTFTSVPPATSTNAMTARDTAVTAVLNRALSFMPKMSTHVMNATTNAAGRSSATPPPPLDDDDAFDEALGVSPMRTRRASGGARNSVAT
mmetsp:Transcript_10232/g.44485  ORF Transcript_10232/g.44485 Transcript_10232/m.44485 type:complete len:253 (+) Transcript_10232:601-1359(+)